jgi:hypothetical protein
MQSSSDCPIEVAVELYGGIGSPNNSGALVIETDFGYL